MLKLSFALLVSALPYQPGNMVTFSGPAVWTCPPGVTSVYVECYGAGGASSGGYIWPAGAGGGGAYAARTVPVTPGKTYRIDNWSKKSGTNFTFWDDKNQPLVSAAGGQGGYQGSLAGGVGGQASDCIGAIKYSGGNGGNTFCPTFVPNLGSGVTPYTGGEGGFGATSTAAGANGKSGAALYSRTGNGSFWQANSPKSYLAPLPPMQGQGSGGESCEPITGRVLSPGSPPLCVISW